MNTGPEPDWGQPVTLTLPLAEAIAQALSKQGYPAVSALQVTTELARPDAGRGTIGKLADSMLAFAWAGGSLTMKDGCVGFKVEEEVARLKRLREQLDSADSEEALGRVWNLGSLTEDE